MSIGPQKPSQAQLRRRRLKVVEHANAGYNAEASSQALGVATGTIGADRQIMRRYITKPPRIRVHGLPPLESYDWVSEPALLPGEPAYRLASPVASAAAFLDRLRSENGQSQVAHAVREAIEARDAAWYVKSQATLADLIAELTAMQKIVTDGDIRRQAMTTASRTDLVTSRHAHPGVQAQDMPKQNEGVLPVKVFAELWRRWHAGVPLDDTTAKEIAKNQNIPLTRVQQAARQFLAHYPQTREMPNGGETE